MSYVWRQLSQKDRDEMLVWRKENAIPWHSPPHRYCVDYSLFHLTAACFDHQPFIGYSRERLDGFSRSLLDVFAAKARTIHAWCVLPNHYHALVETDDLLELLREIGMLHGRMSYAWNGEENARGRKVFFRAADRAIRSEGHFFATLNYIHHNPVHHGYVERWTDWPWSSAAEFLSKTERVEAEKMWREYPILDYGKGWDDASL
jgi:putative transposase